MLRILDVFSFAVFYHFVFFIYLCVYRSAASLGYGRSALKSLRDFGFPYLPIFFLSLRSVFCYFSLCFASLSWAPPTPARFLKKAWQKLLPLFPLTHYLLLIVLYSIAIYYRNGILTKISDFRQKRFFKTILLPQSEFFGKIIRVTSEFHFICHNKT